MARTKGGKRRIYKQKGRLSASKQYQLYCREQYRDRLVPTSSGKFGPLGNLSLKIQEVYNAFFSHLS